jgi:nucleoside 2-deoxyribosyltransferase
MRIYLAGAIWGIKDPFTWRKHAALDLPDWEIIDPTKTELFVENEHEDENARKVVADDLRAIESCNAVLAMISEPSWGTAMEMFYAYQLKIPVIGWNPWPGGRTVGPWIKVHCNIVTSDFRDVKQFLQTLLAKA